MVRTRIAPSPTGKDLHIGNLYTALINWVVAKQNKGKFVVRVEDTDQTRFVKGAENEILNTLSQYSLDPDESPLKGGSFGPYRQSERLKVYQKYAQQLVKKRKAYYCFCTAQRLEQTRKKAQQKKQQPKYDRKCLSLTSKQVNTKIGQKIPYVIRLKIPAGETIFQDLIRGEIKINNQVLDDQVLLKSDGFPTYHLAVVVDDQLMKISHIVRGEEWISSAPKHVLLYKAFGWPVPILVHTPLLRNPDKSKLSKRQGHTSVEWYKQKGYLPKAILNTCPDKSS